MSCRFHVADLSDLQGLNAMYERHFPEPRSARTTMSAALFGGAKVKITAVARPGHRPRTAAAMEWVRAHPQVLHAGRLEHHAAQECRL